MASKKKWKYTYEQPLLYRLRLSRELVPEEAAGSKGEVREKFSTTDIYMLPNKWLATWADMSLLSAMQNQASLSNIQPEVDLIT